MKSQKPLWKVSVATTLEAEDAVAELLGGIFNCSASSYFDVEKHTSVVSVYFSEKKLLSREVREEIHEGLKQIKNCGLKIGAGKISISKICREDWANSWKRHFKPIEIRRDEFHESQNKKTGIRGDHPSGILIKPSWSKRRPKRNQAVVILDPGLSFGTGQHATTSFCLREIVRCQKFGTAQSFLDIGTGSGILAIAAAKLNYKPVHAFDFDAEAVRIAKANAKSNGVKIKIQRGDVTKLSMKPKEKSGLICANLISNLLIAERKKIVAQLNPGGTLAVAGILKSEFSLVRKTFEDLGMKLIAAKTEKEWRSGSFRFAKFF